MRSTPLHLAAIGAALIFSCAPCAAHHSFAAEFDAAKPVSLAGAFTRMEWTNPHAHIHLDVAGRAGTVTSWRVELGTPNDLMRGGWSKTTVKPGDRITVNGYSAKDGSRFVTARTVTASDGRTLFVRPTLSRR